MFAFSILKTMQAAAWLLKKKSNRRNSFGVILKLLYLADREALARDGFPITADHPVAMKHGMLLSETYNLIRGRSYCDRPSPNDLTLWGQYFSTDHHDLVLLRDPGDSELSDFEVQILDETWQRFGGCDFKGLRRVTHRLPEYLAVEVDLQVVRMVPVHYEDVLTALGRQGDMREIALQASIDDDLARVVGDRN